MVVVREIGCCGDGRSCSEVELMYAVHIVNGVVELAGSWLQVRTEAWDLRRLGSDVLRTFYFAADTFLVKCVFLLDKPTRAH